MRWAKRFSLTQTRSEADVLRGAASAWPDETQRLLLHAALDGPETAAEAWRAWDRTINGHTLDPDSHRILPLLYRNLEGLEIDDAEQRRLSDVYSESWLRNQPLLHEATLALKALGDRAIDTIVLKGLALTVAHYQDGGTRPMSDVDILVRPVDAADALRALVDLGYAPVLDVPFERQFATRHAIALSNRAGFQLDLHWYALYQSPGDSGLWTDSVPLVVSGIHTRRLCPSDQLLHVCVHGVSGESPGPMRWLADAVTVIRTSGAQLNWERFVDRAIELEYTVALSGALAQVTELVDVPLGVIERLRAARSSWSERLAHRAAARPYAAGSRYVFEWDRYRRLRAARAPGVRGNFAAHLVDYLRLDGYGHLVLVLGYRFLRLVRHRQVR